MHVGTIMNLSVFDQQRLR